MSKLIGEPCNTDLQDYKETPKNVKITLFIVLFSGLILGYLVHSYKIDYIKENQKIIVIDSKK